MKYKLLILTSILFGQLASAQDYCPGGAESARDWLARARLGEHRDEVVGFNAELLRFQDCLKALNKKPEDFGSSEKEMLEIARAGYESAARSWLRLARANASKREVDGTRFAPREIHEFLKYAKLSEKSIRHFGTTGLELNKLRQRGREASAEDWLKTLREAALKHTVMGSGNLILGEMDQFLKAVKKSKKPLGHYGVEVKDLRNLELTGYESEAKTYLEVARQNAGRRSVRGDVEYFREMATKSGKPLTAFKTSEEELKKLEEASVAPPPQKKKPTKK